MKYLIWFLIRHFFTLKKTQFLVILQNNNELRSTGGYITSVFELEIGKFMLRKRVLSVETELCKHKKVEAPQIIQEMLFDGHLKTWTFRDANYSPDFGKTAKQLIEFYNLVYPTKLVSGLLTINYSFVETWIEFIGSIRIEEKEIDHQNLFTFVSAQTSDIDRHDLKVLAQRKSILNRLAKKIILKTFLKPWGWLKLLSIIKRGFKNKELQFHNPSVKQSFAFKAKPNEDFLAVIENNYLGHKSNRYVVRTVHHDSLIDENEKLINTVRVKWEHFGGNDYPLSGNYRAHIRFYLPKEAILERTDGYEISKEDDFLVLGAKLSLNTKETLEKEFKYSLPKKFATHQYNFRYFKQSGVKNELLRKSFSLPQWLSYKKETTVPFVEGMAIKTYENLSTDAECQLEIEKSKNHPRIYSHVVIGLQQILIKFNEPIYFDPASHPISIYEKNKPENKIEVENLVSLNENRWLLIQTKNLPSIDEIFYHITLKDILNRSSIPIEPNPKQLTVVYRSKHFEHHQKQLISFLQNQETISTKKISKKSPNLQALIDFKSNFLKNACYPAGHYYSPIISVDEIRKREKIIWKNLEIDGLTAVDLKAKNQKKLIEDLSAFYKDIPFKEEKQPNLRYYFKNDWYSYTDGIILYAMIRHFKPKRIIEVGSGYSSALMLDVNEIFFNHQLQLTFIEPYTERLFSLMTEKDKSEATVIQKNLQDIPLEVFKKLEKGDILFIDSTHVVKCGSDVQYILFEILPVLKSGVMIHFHDIFYPFEYPKQWVLGGRNWNEDYFLRAFLMYNQDFEIKIFSHYLHRHHKEIFEKMPLAFKNPGGNLWIEKK